MSDFLYSVEREFDLLLWQGLIPPPPPALIEAGAEYKVEYDAPLNRAMRADAVEALSQVREGAPLASALAAKKRFPGLLPMFARLGEQTGQLPQMLDRAAQQLASEVQRRALALAFTRFTFFRCFFLVFRSFSRPLAMIAPLMWM